MKFIPFSWSQLDWTKTCMIMKESYLHESQFLQEMKLSSSVYKNGKKFLLACICMVYSLVLDAFMLAYCQYALFLKLSQSGTFRHWDAISFMYCPNITSQESHSELFNYFIYYLFWINNVYCCAQHDLWHGSGMFAEEYHISW